MAYRIVYGPEPSAARPIPKPQSSIPLLTGCFFLLFLFLVRTYWPDGRTVLARLLLPGNPAVTEEALALMVSALKNGDSLAQAFTTFCQQILSHGTLV